MMTVRQIERLYSAKDYSRLLHDLTSHRADALIRWDSRASRPTLAAAMAAMRLDELNQAHHPYCGKLLQVVLAAQESDGGWGDPLTTALCLRALLASRGDGMVIERGVAYLAQVQRDEGAFPTGPFRRMPADTHVTAGVMYLLAEYPAFWAGVRAADAADWLDREIKTMDEATRVVWRHGSLRCRLRPAGHAPPRRTWSQVA
jgi:hypothetical protein